MTEKECEKQCLLLMERAYKLFKVYNPDGNLLSMSATEDGCCVQGFIGPTREGNYILDGFKGKWGVFRFGGEVKK